MNRKYILALAIAATTTLVLAAPRGSASKQPSVFLLKSQGKTIAELRVESGTSCEVTSQGRYSTGQVEYDETTRTLTASNGVVLKIMSGTNSITVTADEIEGRSNGGSAN